MKNKFIFLIKQSLKKKIDTKWFKIANVFILVLFLGISNIDKVISFFGGDFSVSIKIYVVDEINSYSLLENNFKVMRENLEDIKSYELIKSEEDISLLKEKIKDTKDIILNIKKSEYYISGDIISYNQVDTITEQLITTNLNNIKNAYVLTNSTLSEKEINALKSSVTLTKEVINKESEKESNKDMITGILTTILIAPCFLLITMLAQMIGAEINDEKSTRSMEIIIANIPPKIHFLSKILASTIFVLIQSLLFILYGLLGLLIRYILGSSLNNILNDGNILNEIMEVIKNTNILEYLKIGAPVLIVMFISSFLIYATLAGILASMTTNIEDYQQLQSPLMIILVAGYYISLMANAFDGSIFIKVISFIPMLSFLVAPVIYLLGQITILELIISTIICVLFTYLIFHFGLRIYKVGILNYSSQDLWKKIFKSIKEK